MTKTSSDTQTLIIQHHWQTLTGSLSEWKNRRQAPPVLLLTGLAGIGKRTVAQVLARWILCEKNGLTSSSALSPLLPCETCPSCHRLQSGNSVDLIEITSESEDDSKTLKVDQFRKLKSTAGFGAYDGRSKIILIPSADRMTPQAANSMLKILEETPEGWIFLLTATDSSLLLPTLVSRCQVLKLKPFSSLEIQKLLKSSGILSDQVNIFAELSQGSWERALNFADEETSKQREALFEFLSHPGSQLLNLVDWASQGTNHFDTLVDLLEQLTADFVRWSCSSHSPEDYAWLQADGKRQLILHVQNIIRQFGTREKARKFWIKRAERLAEVRQEALAPLNRKLLAQDILIPWVGARL